MITRVIKTLVDEAVPLDILEEARNQLVAHQAIGIPTETVYGLAANALDPLACSRIFAAKNRPTDNPLICHISSFDMLSQLVQKRSLDGALDIPTRLLPVLNKFWPGPLTVLLPKASHVEDIVTAGLATVGVRFPSHPIAQAIIEHCGFPLAAPSANLSGRPSPTCASHVLADLSGRIPLIIDGGSSSVGLESTVLDATVTPPMILRPGAITATMLRPYLPDIQVYGAGSNSELEERPPTPGLKYKHYSPTAPVVLLKLGPHAEYRLDTFMSQHPAAKIVRLANSKIVNESKYSLVIYLSTSNCMTEIARCLFSGLREADLLSPDFIVAEEVANEDEGLAIMNRLIKATSIFI